VTEALLLDSDLTLRVGSRSHNAPQSGEVLVRLEWAGVCGSDLHVLRTGDWVTTWPATIGHEAVGVVDECPGGEIAVGTRVVLDSRVPCGRCEGCEQSANLCSQLQWVGEAMPGGFQREGVFDVAQVVACPPEIDPAVAVLAEPLAVAMHAVNRIVASSGRLPGNALLLGYGPIGALVHTELVRRRPDIVVAVVEPDSQRWQMAIAGGAIAPEAGRLWPLVIDAAGYQDSLSDALAATKNGGTVALVALAHSPVLVSAQAITEASETIVGCIGFVDELVDAVAALASDPQNYRWLITEAVSLADAPTRLAELLTRPAAGKCVVRL